MGVKLLLSFSQGATIVDQVVKITPAENYVPNREMQVSIARTLISWYTY